MVTNLVQMFEETVRKYPRRTALVFGAKNISYEQVSSASKKMAAYLAGCGIKKSDKVALWLPNCPEFIYSYFAIVCLNAVVVPINIMFKKEEARFVLEDSTSKILITSIDKVSDSEAILARLETLDRIISLPAPQTNKVVFDFYKCLNNSAELKECFSIHDDDIAEIVYTSGTTGNPKGACLTHKNILSNVRDCSRLVRVSKRDCFLCVLPLFHSFASTVCMLLPLSRGAKIVIMRTLSPFKRVVRTIFNKRVTVFPGIPSIFSILAELPIPRWKIWLSRFVNPLRLCISGAADLPASVCCDFQRRFWRRLRQGYGLTEASPVVALNPIRGKYKPESVGLPLESVRVKIVDFHGKELPRGSVGELLVKGPNVMKEYYNLSEDTQKALEGGWLHTGDLAKVDNDNFIYVMGRMKEMINVRGLNVYPREIENVLYNYPGVKEAVVVGVLHRRRGEVPAAFVAGEGNLDENQILKYLRQNLAAYKVPLRIFFKDALPKNSTGKILKKELQKEIEEIFQ